MLVLAILFSMPFIAFAGNNDTINNSIPAAQANTTGILKIITIPVDGAIYIDNVFAGSGLYYNASFQEGIYRVSFGAVEGYESPKNQTLSVSAGNQTNIIAQYIAPVITPPDVSITKEADRSSVAIDETVNLIVKIKNRGTTKVSNVSLNDSVPDCAAVGKGDISWSGSLDSGESRILNYEVRPAKPGLCIFPPARAAFQDTAGNRFSRFSDEVKVTVSPKPVNEPHLVVEKNVDKSTAQVDEGAVITLKMRNDGSARALNVTLADTVPSCAEVTQGSNYWSGELATDEEKTITYIVSLKAPGLCTLDAAKAGYANANGNSYIKYSEQLNVYVKEKSVSESLDSVVKPLVIIGTAIGSLVTIITVYRSIRNRIPGKKG